MTKDGEVLLAKKKSNWEVLSEQTPSESVKYRDVYNDQQIGHSDFGTKGTMTSRIILATVIAALIALLFYFVLSLVTFVMLSVGGMVSDTMGSVSGMNSSGEMSGPAYDLSMMNPADYNLTGFGTGSADVIYMSIPGNGTNEIVPYWKGMTEDDFIFGLRRDFGWTITNGGIIEMSGMTSVSGAEYDTNGLDALWRNAVQSWDYCVYQGNLFEPGNLNPGDGYLDVTVIGYDSASYNTGAESVSVNAVTASASSYFKPTQGKVLATLLVFAISWLVLYLVLWRNYIAQGVLEDSSIVNQYPNDQHIALPEEVQTQYDWFPDVGAHSSIQVSSMLSHMALKNKGLNPVFLTRRAGKDIKDESGDVIYYKGEAILDEDGEPIMDKVPCIDEKFMQALFEASGAPDDKAIRVFYDPTKISYNPGDKNRDKMKGCETVADLINKDWELPEYEPQRPGGAYVVDTQPVNTMV